PRGFQKVPMRRELGSAMPSMANRLSRAIPLKALQPFDGDRFADLIAPPGCPAAHLASLHRINHSVTQVLRIGLRHSCWPPPSQQVESKPPRFGNPTPRFNATTARSRDSLPSG